MKTPSSHSPPAFANWVRAVGLTALLAGLPPLLMDISYSLVSFHFFPIGWSPIWISYFGLPIVLFVLSRLLGAGSGQLEHSAFRKSAGPFNPALILLLVLLAVVELSFLPSGILAGALYTTYGNHALFYALPWAGPVLFGCCLYLSLHGVEAALRVHLAGAWLGAGCPRFALLLPGLLGIWFYSPFFSTALSFGLYLPLVAEIGRLFFREILCARLAATTGTIRWSGVYRGTMYFIAGCVITDANFALYPAAYYSTNSPWVYGGAVLSTFLAVKVLEASPRELFI